MESKTPLAMMIVSLLSHAGCEVQVANTGGKGLALALESEFDLIVLAVDLPGSNGFEICRELKQRHIARHTPVVFTSARPCEEDRLHALGLGAVDYIVIPFEMTDFIFRIVSQAKAKPPLVMALPGKDMEKAEKLHWPKTWAVT